MVPEIVAPARSPRRLRAASALNYRGIVTIYESGATAEVDFIAMEYMWMGSLSPSSSRGAACRSGARWSWPSKLPARSKRRMAQLAHRPSNSLYGRLIVPMPITALPAE
jgi:hypothetical protein